MLAWYELSPVTELQRDLSGEQLKGFHSVPVVAVDQPLDAGISVLTDQIDRLGHRGDVTAPRSAHRVACALRRDRGIIAGERSSCYEHRIARLCTPLSVDLTLSCHGVLAQHGTAGPNDVCSVVRGLPLVGPDAI